MYKFFVTNILALISCVLLSGLTPVTANEHEGVPSWLYVQTAPLALHYSREGGEMAGLLTMHAKQPLFGFTDRPFRQSGHIEAHPFSNLWSPGKTFSEDNPNAVLSWNKDGDMVQAEIILTDAKVTPHSQTITYSYTQITGVPLDNRMIDVSLFIDSVTVLGFQSTDCGGNKSVGKSGSSSGVSCGGAKFCVVCVD